MDHSYDQYFRMLGMNIAFYRKMNGMTQLQLAEMLDISRTHMSNIEAANVNTRISMELLFRMADVFGIDPRDLLDFSRF